MEKETNKQANTDFDTIIQTELKKRLNRAPKSNEAANADTDSDLVNETLWQMIAGLYDRIEALEKKGGVKPKLLSTDVNSMNTGV